MKTLLKTEGEANKGIFCIVHTSKVQAAKYMISTNVLGY